MADPTRLGVNDERASPELIEATYGYLLANPEPALSTREEISLSPDCDYVSDAIKQAAVDLGIFATREMHFGHVVSVFSNETIPPSPTDPILCLTWGQFLSQHKIEELKDVGVQPYFGEREGIRQLVGSSAFRRHLNYAFAYSPRSVVVRFERDYDTGEHRVLYKSKHYQTKIDVLQKAGWLVPA